MKDEFSSAWILEKGIPIVRSYHGNITLRQLYYRLVSLGMTNSDKHYGRVKYATAKARWNGSLHFSDFVDLSRQTVGNTKYERTDPIEEANSTKETFEYWLEHYNKNKWENQRYYVEVFIEKQALQGVFAPVCRKWDVALNPCKGNPSLSYLYAAIQRMTRADRLGKKVVVLYFGDYDPTGEDIPRSIEENFEKMGFYDFTLERRLLLHDQVVAWDLPPAPTKKTDPRTANWDGIGQVELDAILPEELEQHCEDAIRDYFSEEKHDELEAMEEQERGEYQERVKEIMIELAEGLGNDTD